MQLITFILKFPHCVCIWILDCSIFGGESQVLQEAAKPAAAVENVAPSLSQLCFLAETIHYLLPHHNDQFAVGYEDFRRLVTAQAVIKHSNGFVKGTETQPALLWNNNFFGRILLASNCILFCRWQHLERGFKRTDSGWWYAGFFLTCSTAHSSILTMFPHLEEVLLINRCQAAPASAQHGFLWHHLLSTGLQNGIFTHLPFP